MRVQFCACFGCCSDTTVSVCICAPVFFGCCSDTTVSQSALCVWRLHGLLQEIHVDGVRTLGKKTSVCGGRTFFLSLSASSSSSSSSSQVSCHAKKHPQLYLVFRGFVSIHINSTCSHTLLTVSIRTSNQDLGFTGKHRWARRRGGSCKQ